MAHNIKVGQEVVIERFNDRHTFFTKVARVGKKYFYTELFPKRRFELGGRHLENDDKYTATQSCFESHEKYLEHYEKLDKIGRIKDIMNCLNPDNHTTEQLDQIIAILHNEPKSKFRNEGDLASDAGHE